MKKLKEEFGLAESEDPHISIAMLAEPTSEINFYIDGETLLTIGKDGFKAKGLIPITNAQELHDLMLEFFRKVNKQ